MTTRLYIIRHGQVVDHHEFRYNGHYDVDITAEGVSQMFRLADMLKAETHPITAIYSSDLTRAVKGADIISKSLGLKPKKLEALRELHLGRWEGLTRQEAGEKYPEEAGFTFMDLAHGKLKDGESLKDLEDRVLPAIDNIVDMHKGSSVCLILHGGVNRVILCEALGLPVENFFRFEQDYGGLSIIDYFDDGIKVVKMLNGGPNQIYKPIILY